MLERFAREQGKDFVAGGSDQHGVFPLGGNAVILGDHGPAVGQQFDVALAGVDHRFNGDHLKIQVESYNSL